MQWNQLQVFPYSVITLICNHHSSHSYGRLHCYTLIGLVIFFLPMQHSSVQPPRPLLNEWTKQKKLTFHFKYISSSTVCALKYILTIPCIRCVLMHYLYGELIRWEINQMQPYYLHFKVNIQECSRSTGSLNWVLVWWCWWGVISSGGNKSY